MSAEEYTILIVDDSKLIRKNVRNILAELKIKNISEASNGVEAVRILKTTRVDMIVSDWNMPYMNGQQLLEYVRRKEETQTIPFFMLTAEGEKDKVLAALEAGVSNYIIKPFNKETLFRKLRKYLPQEFHPKNDFGQVNWQD